MITAEHDNESIAGLGQPLTPVEHYKYFPLQNTEYCAYKLYISVQRTKASAVGSPRAIARPGAARDALGVWVALEASLAFVRDGLVEGPFHFIILLQFADCLGVESGQLGVAVVGHHCASEHPMDLLNVFLASSTIMYSIDRLIGMVTRMRNVSISNTRDVGIFNFLRDVLIMSKFAWSKILISTRICMTLKFMGHQRLIVTNNKNINRGRHKPIGYCRDTNFDEAKYNYLLFCKI